MPLERVKQGFKDLSMSFRSNPINDDLIGLKNESAIARSIKNLVFMRKGEKFFDPEFVQQYMEPFKYHERFSDLHVTFFFVFEQDFLKKNK